MKSGFPHYTSFQTFWHKSFYKLNDLYAKSFHPVVHYDRPTLSAQVSSDTVYSLLVSDKPCMIARYGSTELYCLSNYLGIQQGWKNALGFIQGTAEPWWWAPERVNFMRDNAGFFPVEETAIIRFCEMMLEDSKQLDLLASWLRKEQNVKNLLSGTKRIFLPYLEPWYAEQPWTRTLSGKRVVVVHPFAELIQAQYDRRKYLFDNPEILPEFDLRTIPAVQSMGGENKQGFVSWFDALAWMEQEITREPFDIALIGCGAYGFPLAAYVKRSGKKAVHMGGALQLLFGIKGNRWEDPMYGVREWGLPKGFYLQLFNDYWVKPGEETKPKNASQVEGACYW